MNLFHVQILVYCFARGIVEAMAGTYPKTNEISILLRVKYSDTYCIWGIDPSTCKDYLNNVEKNEAIDYIRNISNWCDSVKIKKHFPCLKNEII